MAHAARTESECGGIERRLADEADDLSCSLDDQIAHLIRAVMLQAQEIAQHPDQGAFDRLVDQQTRVADAFNAGRRHIVNVCEQRNRDRLATPYQFRGAA